MTGIMNRESLLKRENFQVEKVELTTGEVYVKQMSGKERDAFEQSLIKEVKKGGKTDYERNLENFRAKLAVVTLCDENGGLLLNFSDYPLLSENMSALNLERIVNVASRINGISEEDKEKALKNSSADQAEDSISD